MENNGSRAVGGGFIFRFVLLSVNDKHDSDTQMLSRKGRRGSNVGCSCSKLPPFLCFCPLNQPMKHQHQNNGIHQRLFPLWWFQQQHGVKPTRPNVLAGSVARSVYSTAHPPVGQIWKCWVGKLKPSAASPSEVCVWVRTAPISEHGRVKEEKGTAGID